MSFSSSKTAPVRAGLLVAVVLAAAACGSSEPSSSSAASSTVARSATTTSSPSTTAATDATDPGDETDAPSTTRAGSSGPSSSRPSGASPSRLAAGPITVITLGDSLTEGAGDDDRHGYPERLQLALEKGDHAGSEVINLGASGWSSTQLLEGQDDAPAQLDTALPTIRDAKAAGRPAVAIVLIGSNDLWYLYANEAPTTRAEEEEDLVHYRANLDKLAGALVDAGAVLVLGINDDQSKRPVAADANMRREAFPDISDAEVTQMSAQAERYADVVRDVAAEHGALVADFLHAPFFTNRALLADDGNHPNASGYDAMTEIWLTALEPLIG
jgi:lysophospholipase L1-like esterase